MTVYVLYDRDLCYDEPAYGVYSTPEKANEAIDWLVEQMINEILKTDPKESGVDIEEIDKLRIELRADIAIQPVELDSLKY